MSATDNGLTIIVPTHDSYIDVFAIFLQLFRKYWPDFPYKLVLSCTSFVPEDGRFEGVEVLNNGDDCQIIGRIHNAAKRYPSAYYLVLLEDMFFEKPVDGAKFADLMTKIDERGISYCRLMPAKGGRKIKLSYPSKVQPYAISLMAFICDNAFVREYFENDMSGWEFEGLQLKKTLDYCKKERFESAVICSGNPLNLIHGIAKGKWIRKAHGKIKRRNREINLEGRERLSIGATVKSKIFALARGLSPKRRVRWKRFLSKLGFKFTTDY